MGLDFTQGCVVMVPQDGTSTMGSLTLNVVIWPLTRAMEECISVKH